VSHTLAKVCVHDLLECTCTAAESSTICVSAALRGPRRLQGECKSRSLSWQHHSGQMVRREWQRAALHLFAADDAHGAGQARAD
jgi:hypothetical protein